MRIAVMGAGALGCYYGGRLQQAGADVTFIARDRTVGVLRQGGLTVEMMDDTLHLPKVAATTDPAEIGPVDVIIFATKLYDVDDAARAMAPMIGPDTHVLSLQNGVYTEELLSELYGETHVWGAQSMLPAQVIAPGHVRQIARIDRLEFGRLDNVQDDAIKAFRDLLEAAGVWALLAENTLESLWRKFIMVGSYAAISTLVRARLGTVRGCPESWQLYRELMQEAFAVGQAKGAGMADDQVDQHWADGLKRDPEVETSMQFDRERGARLELDWFSGYIVREGERLGIPTPCHRVAWMALKPWAEGA
ncbi:MAG: 2-dehydropantoate 2-reductase [Minwuia sp.]|nr:2-dehydropantoate 2-reductase [Minwuia sp.]